MRPARERPLTERQRRMLAAWRARRLVEGMAYDRLDLIPDTGLPPLADARNMVLRSLIARGLVTEDDRIYRIALGAYAALNQEVA